MRYIVRTGREPGIHLLWWHAKLIYSPSVVRRRLAKPINSGLPFLQLGSHYIWFAVTERLEYFGGAGLLADVTAIDWLRQSSCYSGRLKSGALSERRIGHFMSFFSSLSSVCLFFNNQESYSGVFSLAREKKKNICLSLPLPVVV